MKAFILGLFIVLLSIGIAAAQPFLVSDPSTQAVGGKFEIKEGTSTILSADNQADGSIKADLAAVTVGTHTYQVRYVVTDPMWGGTQTSAYVPFTFTRPSLVVGNITGLKLVP
jgi:hypothetical protein